MASGKKLTKEMACVQYKQAFRDTGRAEWQDVQPIVPQQPASSHTENYKQQITAAGDAGSVVTGKVLYTVWFCSNMTIQGAAYISYPQCIYFFCKSGIIQ